MLLSSGQTNTSDYNTTSKRSLRVNTWRELVSERCAPLRSGIEVSRLMLSALSFISVSYYITSLLYIYI